MDASGKSQRVNQRLAVTCDLSAHLFTENAQFVRCLGINISKEGLGIVGFAPFEVGTKLTFRGKTGDTALEVIWCKPGPKPEAGKEQIYHAGLRCLDLSHDFAKLARNEGLLGEPAIEDQAAPKIPSVDFNALREVIAKLIMPDQQALKAAGLERLNPTHKAFPVNYENHSLLILLPAGLKPIAASQLDDAEAMAKIVIFKTEKQGLIKVWPLLANARPDK